MPSNHYFVEFPNYDAALKFQERYRFLIGKYKRLSEELAKLKKDKLLDLNAFLSIVRQLGAELDDFKKLVPKPRKKVKPKTTVKKSKRRTKKKPKLKKALPEKSLKSLRKGLEDIRKELTQM